RRRDSYVIGWAAARSVALHAEARPAHRGQSRCGPVAAEASRLRPLDTRRLQGASDRSQRHARVVQVGRLRTRTVDVAIDVVIIAAVLLLSATWATRYWNQWVARGGQPVFYQEYFEPAVMIACHHGFTVSELRPQALTDFLQRRRDTFSCT